jgi:hypothetical protein
MKKWPTFVQYVGYLRGLQIKKPEGKPFDKWLEENYPNWEEKEIDCPECEGSGYLVCLTCAERSIGLLASRGRKFFKK